MALRVPIDAKKLSDSPLHELNKSIFRFVPSDTKDFVNDLLNGNPTCYLISGYRGAGKSSFVKKVESEVKSKLANSLFVHLNFAKHEPRTILLRKLIRNFYLQLTSSDNKQLYQALSTNTILQSPIKNLEELYERTFYDVSKNSNEKRTILTASTKKIEFNLQEFLTSVIYGAGIIVLIIKLDLREWYSYILITLITLALILPFAKYFSYSKSLTKGNEKLEENSKNSFYDDEIAEFLILNVIKDFSEHVKITFVLDELDKINDDKLVEGVINELKPLMLSGVANFIAVAGQDLFYNYYFSQQKDDSTMASLFAKVHHISLLPVAELKNLFYRLIKASQDSFSQDETEILNCYADLLIIGSRRIPRRFILLIRQNLIWDNNEGFLEITKSLDELKIYSRLSQSIEKIHSDRIAPEGYPEAINDYLTMQLYLKVDEIINHNSLQ